MNSVASFNTRESVELFDSCNIFEKLSQILEKTVKTLYSTHIDFINRFFRQIMSLINAFNNQQAQFGLGFACASKGQISASANEPSNQPSSNSSCAYWPAIGCDTPDEIYSG